ncbi:QA-SNARE protein [Leishmania donovani]|uniref:QA-SNARE_protein_putative n=3 Tax=Leishmania donovani species complex TaxID=38574 RepID=A0A6L0XIU5_LEIIN|nr:QA-SNARE protein putative [Leishmania infantum JPCM5]XP_003860190.1 QA-SNARE protein putative [Leishmania donovani]CAC9482252.1 QA-SNARE_protein_putative [Leishmania infantum]AYU78109.1 QA-SNARE protein putative [Leishmania donovani]TPP41867.1 SNARE domain family protein [Leishmania donovani]TPP51055.1 SNARE domain family protein [Leishmania donovani]CAJ1988126.1 QA-SNARE protein [Leishmania donovani]|eukprot:XP_003392415.1 QA-SNARE protein putative [Leishmania infantum JPCM5]
MPLENGEVLSRCVQQVAKACSDAQSSVKELGTGRDAIARDRLRRIRLLVQQCNSRVEELLSDAEPFLESLRQQYAQQKAVFELINAEATRRERQTFRQTDPASMREGDLDALEPQVTFCEARPLNVSEFHTEEAIQREKLQSAREVESDVMDLKMAYQEFHSLVHQQQESLDRVTNNVTESRSLIERGHDQIQGATRRQRSFRKIGCISGAVVIVIMTIVIIVVTVATR